jgi:3-methyladenine DNA glycosylase AlkD
MGGTRCQENSAVCRGTIPDMNAADVQKELQEMADPGRAKLLGRYFKTGKGEYGEGDIFIGLKVPEIRLVAKRYKDLPLGDVETLLVSPIHEFRLTALIILTYVFEKADEVKKKSIYDFYLSHTKYINNWDLVDLSSHEIIGGWLINHPKERGMLYRLAKSGDLWEKRIAMISCFAFLNNKEFKEILTIAEMLLHDKHDLIHKAVGWGLREVGKRDLKTEENFLLKHYKSMPRTMLRYAIEKFPEKKRKFYMT